MVGEDEVGLQDGQRLGVRVGAGLVDDDVQRSAVVLHAGHLHVLWRSRRALRGNGKKTAGTKTRELRGKQKGKNAI